MRNLIATLPFVWLLSCSPSGAGSGSPQTVLPPLDTCTQAYIDCLRDETACNQNSPAVLAPARSACGEQARQLAVSFNPRDRPVAPTCLPAVPIDLSGHPQCVVGFVDEAQPGSAPDVALPACGSKCCTAWANTAQPTNMNSDIINACSPESQDCYCAMPSGYQPDPCPKTAVFGIWLKANLNPPVGKVASVRCLSRN